ncbi:MAG: DUF1822 family protein, partial [Cyanobacteria bacterium P01_D01_bin.36]
REPEIIILKGTWRGLTYEQMAGDSEYSTNYLMRDVAPKLWKQLSGVFGRSVGKTNFRVALEAYAVANAAMEADVFSSVMPDESYTEAERFGISQSVVDVPLGADSTARREAERGWLLEGEGLWSAARATLLSTEAILPGDMYGYGSALTQLQHWLAESSDVEGRSRLIGVWGLRGVGKTLLMETAVSQAGGIFEGIVWRSLQDRPTLNDLSISVLASLGISVPAGQAIAKLLSVLASRSLLLVLEDVESLLQTGSLAGDYAAGYRSYGDFFESVATSASCILLSGLEGPSDWVRQGGYDGNQSVRSLTLLGLVPRDANALLEGEQLSAPEKWAELIDRYQGHPLALKSAARVIREIFNGRVDTFLAQSSVLFNGIFRLLSPSFDRLSVSEVNVLYWLAGYESPLSLAELQDTLPLSLRPSELISALDSLKQRSFLLVNLQSDPPTFCLPTLVKAYAVHRFMGQFSSDSRLRAQERPMSSYAALGQVINLSPMGPKPVQLGQWFQGQFEAEWHSLDWLFDSTSRPAIRLRSAYHLRDKTFLKRCKPIVFNSVQAGLARNLTEDLMASPGVTQFHAVLLVAINKDAEGACQVCVQVQPAKGENSLPRQLDLRLLDAQHNLLASVSAEDGDTFIQLPYFRGESAETFEIELALIDDRTHRETFVI